MSTKFLIFLFLFLSFCDLSAQNSCTFATIADSLLEKKEYKIALVFYKKAIKSKCLNTKWDYYYAAASAAQCGKKKQAIHFLEILKSKDWARVDELEKDTLFQSLKSLKKWNKLVAELKDTVAFYAPIRLILNELTIEDQLVRTNTDSLSRKYNLPKTYDRKAIILHIDSLLQRQIFPIIDKYGFVSYDIIGRKANNCLFLVVEHSNIPSMEKYFPLLQASIAKENSNPLYEALMCDRISWDRIGKQKYGTQFQYDTKGRKIMDPIDDIEMANKRRLALKILPLEAYMKKNNIFFE
jgi:hypothetical protein